MNRKKVSRNIQPKPIKRQQKAFPWKYCLLVLICGLILAVGFFFAARQHFASIEYGIKNSKLRKQIEELEADKRRLVLAKEIALSPVEIKRAAKKIGLKEMTATEKALSRISFEPQQEPEIEKPEDVKLKQAPVIKTEAVKKEIKEEVKEETKKNQKRDAKTIDKKIKEERKTPEVKDKQEKSKTKVADR